MLQLKNKMDKKNLTKILVAVVGAGVLYFVYKKITEDQEGAEGCPPQAGHLLHLASLQSLRAVHPPHPHQEGERGRTGQGSQGLPTMGQRH